MQSSWPRSDEPADPESRSQRGPAATQKGDCASCLLARAIAGTPVIVFSQDTDLRYDWVFNPFNDPADVIGRTDGDLLEPASAQVLADVKRAAMATGEPQRATVKVVPRDTYPEAIFDLNAAPVTDETGAVAGVVCAATDVSALFAEKEKFCAAVESLIDAFGVYSAVRDESGRIVDFRIEYVNAAACEANMMSREEQVGRLLCHILPGHHDSGLFDDYVRLVETGAPLRREVKDYEDDYAGERLVRAFDVSAARHGDGFVAAWRDVTEKRRNELALDAALKESDLLRRELEHRVTNNLQILASLLNLSARDAEPAVADALRMARRQVELIASLHARLTPRLGGSGRVALDEYLTDVCAALEAGLYLDRQKIAIALQTEPVEFRASEAITLGLIANELVTNAVKHAFVGRDAGLISVRLVREGENLTLTIADDGIGLPCEPSRTGMGEKITGRLARALGGVLDSSSSPAGTTFRLTIPARGAA